MPLKKCVKCKQDLSVDSFWKNANKKDGYYDYCKNCHKEAARNRYKNKLGTKENLLLSHVVKKREQLALGLQPCSACNVEKPWSEFNKNATRLTGYNGVCKQCCALKDKKRREDRSARSEPTTQFRKCPCCNTTKPSESFWINKSTASGLSTYCKICTKAKREGKYDPDKTKVKNLVWRKNNRGRMKGYGIARAKQTRLATPKWANMDKIEEVYKQRDALNLASNTVYHVDHIVPLKSKLVCGLHVEHNLQVLPELENKKKCNYFWPDMPDPI